MSLDRIANEGFNLNVSRYISTSIGEEEIDLSATQADLVSIEGRITDATVKHNEFLMALGLPLLPVR